MTTTIKYEIGNAIYIYPWGEATNEVNQGLDEVEAYLRDHRVDIRLTTVRSGGTLRLISNEIYLGVSAQGHVHAKGRQRGNLLEVHSGWISAGQGNGNSKPYYFRVFKDPADLGRTIFHETLHAFGWKHVNSSSCLMHPSSNAWPCEQELAWMRRRWGTLPTQEDQTQAQIEALKKERQQLWYERSRINDRIKLIDDQIERLQQTVEMVTSYHYDDTRIDCGPIYP